MTIQAGNSIPEVIIFQATADGPSPITTTELFKDKTVILFGVPGAFTPTCSQNHLPGYLAKATEFKAKGVDIIACIAVNDAFVMHSWGKAQNTGQEILMLSDGDAAFTKATGLEFDLSGKGFGLRSQRFAMVIKNNIITEFKLEQPGDFTVF